MPGLSMSAIAHQLNSLATGHPIGRLQEIRKELKGFRRLPGTLLFTNQTIHNGWAFHHGGRTELQFNIGFDRSNGAELRHGVAFSFEPSQTLPDVELLRPKVKRFNEYLRLFPKALSDLRMWHWDNDERSNTRPVSPVSDDLIRNGVFVFLGRMQSTNSLNYEKILGDFDRLLPLYRFVESETGPATSPPNEVPAFRFKSGCNLDKATGTTATHTIPIVEVSLRHNQLQQALYKRLVKEFGEMHVGTENQGFGGTSIDVVVRNNGEYRFYEIKTACSPRACLREAIGQLLEYSFWPGAQSASRLIVVGEWPIDEAGRQYLNTLQKQFSLPITYEHVSLPSAGASSGNSGK